MIFCVEIIDDIVDDDVNCWGFFFWNEVIEFSRIFIVGF